MTGTEAVVEYLREEERLALMLFRATVENWRSSTRARRKRGSAWKCAPIRLDYVNEIRRFRALLAAVQNAERRARIDELGTIRSRLFYSVDDVMLHHDEIGVAIEKRIAELEAGG
jgi:hypothetical protein